MPLEAGDPIPILKRVSRKRASSQPALLQTLILGVWQPTERELVSREEEEGENYPDVCLGLGDDVLGGDGGRMLNLDVFERLVLFCR